MPNINDSIAWAIQKCNDPNVGYSQTYRNQQTVDGITYYDCASFIWYALIAGGFDCVSAYGGQTWPFVVSTMPSVLTNLGFVEVSRTGLLKPGDICIRTNAHTEMVYEGGTGTARTMGAHSSQYALQYQVSINNHWTNGTSWNAIYRYGNGGDTQTLYGVDVSVHNGVIDWSIARNNIDFAIIRAGFGQSTDSKFYDNINGCANNNIPFGVYWFSYALSVQDCIDEANYCCNLLSGYNLSYPVFYDWEYDSDNHAQTHGVTMTNQLRKTFAITFMETVINNGYNAGLYTNPDYILSKGFSFILTDTRFMLWLAQWNTQSPTYSAPIWQYGQGNINGFPTIVDLNKTTGINPRPITKGKFKWWLYLRKPMLKLQF